MSHLDAVSASAPAHNDDEFPTVERAQATGKLTPAQGTHLAQLVNSLYPEWATEDVYEAVGAAVNLNHGNAIETVLAMLNVAADTSNGTPSTVALPGAHWHAAYEQVTA